MINTEGRTQSRAEQLKLIERNRAAFKARRKAQYTPMTKKEAEDICGIIKGYTSAEMAYRVFDQLMLFGELLEDSRRLEELLKQQKNKTAAQKLDEVKAYIEELEGDYRDALDRERERDGY